MAKPLCIYHGNCADGFAAAWVIWRYFEGEVDFYPGVYQRPPPDVTGRDVIMVDFSYKRQVLEAMAKQASSFLLLDHHKTAKEDLVPSGIFVKMINGNYRSYLEDVEADKSSESETQIYTVFDMNRSGCGITWDFCNPGLPRPRLLDHLEDRDLWRFKLPFTREIQANAFSFPYDFADWDAIVKAVEYPSTSAYLQFVAAGAAIERKHFKDINELLEVMTRPMVFRVSDELKAQLELVDPFVTVPVANLSYTMGSDAAHNLCELGLCGEPRPLGEVSDPDYYHHPFAGYYYDKPDGRQFGLRSRKGTGADVGAIAKYYGGGGHENASGFFVPFSRLEEFEP